MNIKRIIKEYNEQHYAHKFDNLDETDQFLQSRIHLLKLIQEEVDNLGKPMKRHGENLKGILQSEKSRSEKLHII